MSNPSSDLPGRWALVTGASAGIGAAYARELARRGWSLVLIARREERLRELAHELEAAHRIGTRVATFDLADPESPERLRAWTDAQSVFVEFLVNNAGYGLPGSFVSQPWARHRHFIELMIATPAALCWHYLPPMRERRRGHIVNIASLAGLVPGSAGHTLYGAAKSLLIRFSQSLALENQSRGIHVTAHCPGFTWSEFHDVNGARRIMSKMPKWMWMDADSVASDGVAAALRGDVVRVPGRINRLIKTYVKYLPDWLALRMVQRRSKHFRVLEE